MKRFSWLAMPALVLSGLTLTACHKAPDGAGTTEGSLAAADASSVTPVDGMPTMAASSADSDNPDGAPGVDPATYLAKAGAADLFEIESSRAILKTTQDARIESFAKMMIKDHEASTAMLKKAAKTADVSAPAPHLQPEQQQTLDSINAASGKNAGKIYLDAQRQGHAAALALHKAYAANGASEPLKAAAAKIVPVVQQHIIVLDKIGQ